MPGGVYAILNTSTGRAYIGSAKCFKTRFGGHRCALRKGAHHSSKLQRSWSKHGEGAFEFREILVCAEKDLLFYEQLLIDFYDAAKGGYNIRNKAAATRGATPPAEVVEKRAAKLRGLKRSDESKRRYVIASTGRKMSPESIEKMRRARVGMPSARKGCNLSDETKQKLRDANLGKKYPYKPRARGYVRPPMSAEARAKISAAKIGKPGFKCPPEHATKLSMDRAKFTAEEVIDMRGRHDRGETATSIANLYGCGLSTAHRICTRKNYTWVGRESPPLPESAFA